MLRITVHEDETTWRLQLEGRLAGEWVTEAERAWHAAPRAGLGGKEIEIDLSDVSGVDEAGKRLLGQIGQSGVRFLANGIATRAMVGEITGKTCGLSKACSHFKKMFGVITLAIAMSSAMRAQDVPAPIKLTLKEAVNISLKQNPQVVVANLNLAESQENTKISRSALLPQASLGANEKVTRANVEALFGSRIPSVPQHIGPFWTTQVGPNVSAPLFDLTAWDRWKASRELVNTSAAEQTTAREQNAQLVVSQYLGSLRAAASVKAAQSRLDLAKDLFDLATDLQKSGVGTGIDTLRANVQYQNERQRFSEADTQLKVSLYGLSRLLNLDPQQPIELADEPSFFETPEFASDQSLTQAYIARPEMRSLLSQVKATELQKQATKDQRLPRMSVGGGWSEQGLTPTSMIPVYTFAATVEVPIFTGGRIKAETAVADIELKKLEQNEQDLRNRIGLEVKSAIAQLESAKVQVEAANLGVNLATEGVTQAEDRFRAGVANNIEVVTAQDEYARANDNQISALYRYNQSRADLARATGQIEALYTK
jgi:outer membrane protein TolC